MTHPFVLHDVAARIVFSVAAYAWVLAEVVLQFRSRKGRRRQRDWTSVSTVVSIWIGIGLAFSFARGVPWASFGDNWPPVIVGVVVLLCGAGFRL